MSNWAARLHRGGRRDTDAGRAHPGADPAPVTITAGAGPPGPVIPADFAGLSFEVGPLVPGNAAVRGYLFSPESEGIKSNAAPTFRDADWFPSNIRRFPEKVAYAGKLKDWGASFWPRFKDAFSEGE